MRRCLVRRPRSGPGAPVSSPQTSLGAWCADRPEPDCPASALALAARSGLLRLPLPGRGSTWQRWQALAELAAHDLSLARLGEGHADALAILAEAGRPEPPTNWLLGVWAAGPVDSVVAEPEGGAWRLTGRRRWCSGASSITHALVTGSLEGANQLFLVDLHQPGVVPCPGSWPAVGMAGSDSVDVDLSEAGAEVVGGPGFYLGRSGFWHGALGVAACWWGGAVGVSRALWRASKARSTSDRLAHLGAVDARLWSMESALRAAAAVVDTHPQDTEAIRCLALRARHLIERGATEVMDRTGRATGAGPLSHDAAHAQRVADLTVYLRQIHAEADLEVLGRTLIEKPE